MKIRLAIVEDQPLFRDLLRNALGAYGHIEVVSTSGDGRDAIRAAAELRPDAIVMDIDLGGGMTGIEAAQKIKEARPEVGIVLLSSHRDKEYLQAVAEGRGGGWSYLLKTTLQQMSTLVRAIEGSTWGLVTLDSTIVERLQPRAGSSLDQLTERQMLVLKHVAGGCPDDEIAARADIDEGSVDNEIARICDELGVGEGDPNTLRARVAVRLLQETSSR
jgi:DNA-binding NarL/FixJ family response regulator